MTRLQEQCESRPKGKKKLNDLEEVKDAITAGGCRARGRTMRNGAIV